MSNKYTTPQTSTLFLNKLTKLTTKLHSAANPTGSVELPTLEQVISEGMGILSKCLKELAEPVFQPYEAIKDTIPDLDEYNSNFEMIKDDLDIVFAELEQHSRG